MTLVSFPLVESPPRDPREQAVLSDAPLIVDDDASAKRAQEARNQQREQIERDRTVQTARCFHAVYELVLDYGAYEVLRCVRDAIRIQHASPGAFSGDGL